METLCSSPAPDIFTEIPESPDKPEAPSWHPTASQRAGLAKLHELANVFERVGDNKLAGFAPSCRRALVIGTSGSGKSALARQFAAERGVPIHLTDGGSWVVVGSLKTGTLRSIRDFIRSCEDPVNVHGERGPGLQGILWIDEVDKMVPVQEALAQSGWGLSVASEGISLADADSRLYGHDWSPRDVERLRKNFLLLAGGAFMGALTEARKSAKRGALGFKESGDQVTYCDKIRDYLPEELLSRYTEVVILESPTREDLSTAIDRIHSELGVKRSRPMAELLDEAEGAQGAMRWLEAYLCRLIAANPYSVRPQRSHRPEPKQDKAKEGRSYDLLVADIPRALAGANETLGKLNVKLAIIHSRLHALGNQRRDTPWTGMLNNPALGESLIKALRNCQLLTTVSSDDREELSALAQWREAAWMTLAENASDLVTYGLTEIFAESWALTGALVEYRASLSRAIQRGLLG